MSITSSNNMTLNNISMAKIFVFSVDPHQYYNFIVFVRVIHDQYFNLAGLKKTIDYLKAGVFSYTEAYKRAIGVLEADHCVAIIGPPGSGKTITAVQLAYRKCGLSNLFLCQSIDEVFVTAENNKDAYIIVDDWIDEYVYYPSKIDEAIHLLSTIYTNFLQDGNVHLIITAQEDKWNRSRGSLKNCFLCKQNLLLEIDPVKFTKKERLKIVRCHVEHFSGTECTLTGKKPFGKKSYVDKRINDMTNYINGENEFSFPVIIDLICKNERLRPSLSLNLIRKFGFSQITEKGLDNWSQEEDINEKRGFCILIFAALLGGKVSRIDFESNIKSPCFDKICQKFECYYNRNIELIQNQSPEEEIENLLRESNRLKSWLYPICYQKNETEFIFQHQTLFKFVLSYIKKRNEGEFLIENAHIDVLMKHCWIEKSMLEKLSPSNELSLTESPIGSVVLPARYFKTLAARIRSEREQGYQIPDWNNHIFMRHMVFKKIWGDLTQ